ncbi:squalene monooxygenase erg1 [Niveomyces insectorum RCEF 264]|uniref:Squalene monooxygenase n=1 Tax=Niveomyces insectorum RCEF 264 TaxID=1081102 RepID=A0A167QCX8_9HYPO|nr:squalene monooxygenase erg1 [Niveomyces insectorum RCEF 264]
MADSAASPFPRPHQKTSATQHHHADVVVVGAGIFGSAIATAFARQRRSVVLLERSLKEPDRIVGELLQPGGVAALDALGLRHCLDDIDAVPVRGYEVIYNGQPVAIPYPAVKTTPPCNGGSSATKGPVVTPVEGRSFHHGRFVQKLRAAAAAEPTLTLVEAEVLALVRDRVDGPVLGVTAKLAKDGQEVQEVHYFGSLTVVADGYRSKFRTAHTSRKPLATSKFWALELVDADLPAPNFGHVILGDCSPVLLYQIGRRETRALVNVPEGLAEAKPAHGGVSQYLRGVVLPQLPVSVQASFANSLDANRLRCMPNSFLPAAANRVPGLVVAGDALNMRHPLTGGGMTVALNDAVLLRDLLAPARVPRLDDHQLVLRQLHTFHWRRKRLAAVLNILAQALYALFNAGDDRLRVLRAGCFAYFRRGGNCVRGPAELLAGIAHKPHVLVYHFSAVALLSAGMLLSSKPLWRLPMTLFECMAVLVTACAVILPYILAELW